MASNLRPYIIQLVSDVTYNFHGFDRTNGKPNFYMGYASLDTNYYFRTYKHCKNAIREGKKIQTYYKRRKMLKDKQIRIVNMINDNVVMSLSLV